MTTSEFSLVLDLRDRCRTYDFQDDYTNPGIGGSEAYLVHLGMRLFAAGLDVCIVIVGCGNIQLPLKIPVVRFESWRPGPSVIINSGTLEELLLTEGIQRLVVVSHHPFDQNLRLLKRKFRNSMIAIVNLGKFQYESNQFLKFPSSRIPGFWPKIEGVTHSPQNPPILGHIGSLHPSKGFSDVLKVLKKLPPAMFDRLEVVGGAALYGGSADTVFDAKSRHGRKVLRLLDHKNLQGKVIFQGLVPDPNVFSKRWSLAVLNPKGIGEADSQTLKELHSRRVPVFASLHFGLGDFTREHPEYGLSGWRISRDARKLSVFLGSPQCRDQYQALIEQRLLEMKDHNHAVLASWLKLLETPIMAGGRRGRQSLEANSSRRPLRRILLSSGSLLFASLWILERIRKGG